MKWRSGICLGVAVMLACAVFPMHAQESWRVIKNEQVKSMNQFERVQYIKAIDLLNKQQYRAAATEFERFLIQFQSSEVGPYMIFFRAYALHSAKDRNAAISIYNEVLDFYPGEINAAAPALYYRGIAQLENGDYGKGMQTMKELVDDEDYQKHPVAAEAGIKLVENHWKNKEFDRAVKYLQQINRDFKTIAPNTAKNAQNIYGAYALCNTGKIKEYEKWYIDVNKEDARKAEKTIQQLRQEMVNSIYDIFIWNYWAYFQDQMRTKYTGGKRAADPSKELWDLLSSNRDAYISGDNAWSFYSRALRLTADKPNLVKDAEFNKLVQETAALIAKTPDDEKNKDRQQNRYKEIFDFLVNGGRIGDAEFINSRIADKKLAGWNTYRILYKQEKWDDAIKQLDTLAETFKTDAQFVRQSMWSKGIILKDIQRKYDDAIKVFTAISNPPATLWQIQECHYRKGDMATALKVLIEIENAFPDDGPEAAWRRAEYQDRAGNGELAVKEGRYIMKKYPKSTQSSRAHQLLEKYGIDTGGAVRD